MPEAAQIAAQMRWKRQIEGKLKTEFANELHMCEKLIKNLEKAAANPRLKTLKSLATNMGMSVSAFLKLKPLHDFELPANCEKVDPQDISAEIVALALWLKVFRDFSKETQMSFSSHVGVCLDTVNRIERKLSSCNPNLSTLQKFAAYMDITVSELLDTTLSKADMEKLLKERLDNRE